MHDEAYQWVKEQAFRLGPFQRVAEFGGRNINGTVRYLFPGADYTSIDLHAGPGVDVVADAAMWEPDRPVDCVVCCEVLEHAPNPQDIVKSAHRALQAGGVFLMTAACDPREPHSAGDGGPLVDGEHYRNISEKDVAHWMGAADGDEWAWTDYACEVDETHGDIYLMAVK